MFSLRHRGHSRINNVLTVWLWGVRQSDRLRVLKGDTPKFPSFLFFVPCTGRMPAVKLVHAPCRGCALQSVLSLAHLWTRWLLSTLWSKWWKQSCDVTVPLWKSYVLKFCLAVFFCFHFELSLRQMEYKREAYVRIPSRLQARKASWRRTTANKSLVLQLKWKPALVIGKMDYCHVVHKSGGLHQQLVVYHYYKNTFCILFIYWRFTNELFWDKQSNIKKDQILIWGSCPRHNRKSFLTVSALIRKSSTQSRFM